MTRRAIAVLTGLALSGIFAGCSRPAPPSSSTQGDPARGASLFAANCATCHGERGHGDGPAASALQPRPKNLADPALQQSTSDDRLALAIAKGGTAVGLSDQMPAFGATLNHQQIVDIVAFVRSLKSR